MAEIVVSRENWSSQANEAMCSPAMFLLAILVATATTMSLHFKAHRWWVLKWRCIFWLEPNLLR